MRVRLFTEIEVRDDAVIELQKKLDATPAEQRLFGSIELIVADSMARQITKTVESFYGVKEAKSVFVPQLLGL